MTKGVAPEALRQLTPSPRGPPGQDADPRRRDLRTCAPQCSPRAIPGSPFVRQRCSPSIFPSPLSFTTFILKFPEFPLFYLHLYLILLFHICHGAAVSAQLAELVAPDNVLTDNALDHDYGDDFYDIGKPASDPMLMCTKEILQAKEKQCYKRTPEKKIFVPLYRSVELPCQVGNLRGQMQWIRPGVGVLGAGPKPFVHPDKYDYTGDSKSGEKHLLIRNVTMDSEGRYECQVQPMPNLLRYRTTIIVLVKPGKPHMRVNGQKANDNEKVHIRSESSEQSFSCSTIGGNPSPVFQWYKSGHAIQTTPPKPPPVKDVLSYRHEDRITILTSTLQGGETITCSVSNEATKQSLDGKRSISSSVITVKQRPPGRPHIEIVTRKTRYYAGDTFVATCRARVGVPSGSLLWRQYMASGKEGRQFYRYEIVKQTLVNRLEISGLTRADHNSKLTCEASNEMTREGLNSSIKVSVNFPPRSASIQSHPPSHKKVVLPNGRETLVVYGRFGQTKDLTCLTDHYYPTASIYWMKAGQRLPSHRDRVIPEAAGNRLESNISITFSKDDDGEDLQCITVGIKSIRAKAQVRLNIMYPPGKPYIVGYRSSQAVRSGVKVTMQCISEGGNPPPNLHWYRNNGLEKVRGGKERSEGNKRIKDLTFIPRRDDNGDKYVCKSTNAVAGSSEMLSSSPVLINVYFPPERISINSEGQRMVSEGQRVSFVCKSSSANPQVTVQWKKLRCKREDMCTSSKLDVSKVSNLPGAYDGIETHSYVDFLVSWQDHGQFVQCEAVSREFPNMPVRDRMQLNVTFSPKFAPDASRSRAFPEGTTAEVDLNPIANPPIKRHKWLQNIHPVSGHGRLHLTKTKLKIENVNRADMANYTLVVHNGLGETRVSFFLNVTYPPRMLSPSRTNITGRKGKSVELKCRFEGNPAPLTGIVWRRVHPVTQTVLAEVFCRGQRYKNTNIRRKMRARCKSIPKRYRAATTLTITDLDRRDIGLYQCILNNGVGRPALRQFEVLVPSSSVVVINPRLSKSAADIGGSVSINCEAEGEPWVVFTWFRGQDNLTLATGKKYQMSSRRLYPGRYRGTLQVSNVKESDYGDYFCQVSNGMAPDVVRLSLIRPRSPDAAINLRVVNVTASTVTLAWTQGFDGGYPQTFRLRWRELKTGESVQRSESGPYNYQSADIEPSSDSDNMRYIVRGLNSGVEYAFTMVASNTRKGDGPRVGPILAKTRTRPGEKYVPATNADRKEKTRRDDTPILIIVTACVFGGLIFMINVLVITCILRRKGRCRGSHKQEYMKADTVEMYQHHQAPSITGSSQQGADSVTVSEALLHNYREMHPLAGTGMQPEFFEPGLYPGLPPRLVSSVPNSSPVPHSLPPPSPAQSAVLPAHTYVNVDNIMHSSFPRDPNMYHYVRHTTMPRDSYMEDAKRVHFSDSLRQRMTTSGIYASPQRTAPPEPPERTVSNQLSVSQLVIPPPQDFSPPESACESVIERPMVTANSPLRTNQNATPMTNSITTFAAISTDPDDEGYTSVV